MGNDMYAQEHEDVKQVLETWAETTRTGQLDRVLANHAKDSVIFDVLPPLRYEDTESYRRSWDEWQPETPDDGTFELKDLAIRATTDLAFAHGLIQCGGTMPNGKTFSDLVRATFCLQKENGAWKVVHQHISKPFSSGE
jgi:ketosteroid isomerase-like protein